MIDPVWMQVLERIPPESHNNLSIITITGAELVVQQIFKLERDFLIVRARTAGTGDLGRTVVLPFSQIDFLALGGIMSEEAVFKIFGEPMPEFAAPQAVTTPAPPLAAPAPRPAPRTFATAPQPAAPAVEEPPTTPVVAAAVAETPAQKPGQISKTVLLARLRERLAEKAR